MAPTDRVVWHMAPGAWSPERFWRIWRDMTNVNIGYRFKDPRLLAQALAHRSWASRRGMRSNEALECLGDTVVSLHVMHRLYAMNPDKGEGFMSQRHSDLTKNEALAIVGRRMGLERAMVVDPGTAITPRMLANCSEAVFAAAFLDGGLPAVQAIADCVGLVPR